MKDNVHNTLLNAIKDKVLPGTNVANLLTDILFIGKEAAYRRLRGEVPFTLEDVAIISKAIGISIDSVIGQNDAAQMPFQLILVKHVNPSLVDYTHMDQAVKMLHNSRNQSRELGLSANMLPQHLFLKHHHLTKFFLLRCLYQWEGLDNVESLKDITITQRQADIYQRYREEFSYISYSYYIWDHFIFLYLVNDIKCFSRINFISQEDVAALKEELLILVDEMELLASKSINESGSKTEFYLSAVNFENTYAYLQLENSKFSFIKAFTLNSTVSQDKDVCDRLKKWIESLKRLSTLISESGEIQRVQFFKEQRELINTI